jgi:hypothetical protein
MRSGRWYRAAAKHAKRHCRIAAASFNFRAMPLPDRLRLPFSFDPHGLVRDLEHAAAAGWRHHFSKTVYDGDWSVIALRSTAYAKHPTQLIYADPFATDFRDRPVLAECPCFRAALDTFRAPLRSVRLMRLAPGSAIKEHSDSEVVLEDGLARLHIPIVTNADVDFRLNGKPVVMEPGSVWYLRLCDPHSVRNGGTADRVHLVVDATVNGWLAGMLEQARESA